MVHESNIVKDMNKMLSFEGRPPTDPNKPQISRMIGSLVDAISAFEQTQIWPEDIVPIRDLYKYVLVCHQANKHDHIKALKDAVASHLLNHPAADHEDIKRHIARYKELNEQQSQQSDQPRVERWI